MRIVLSETDHAIAVEMGRAWQRNATWRGWRNQHGIPAGQQEKAHILGMLGEVAFRRLFGNLDFPAERTFKDAPDALGCEVRTTSHAGGCLIMRDDDPQDRPYVLMVGHDRTFRCCGWRWGWERKHFHKSPASKNRPSSWLIAQGALRNPLGLWAVTGKEAGRAEVVPE